MYAFVQCTQCVRRTPLGGRRLCIRDTIKGVPHATYAVRLSCQDPKGQQYIYKELHECTYVDPCGYTSGDFRGYSFEDSYEIIFERISVNATRCRSIRCKSEVK